MTLPSSTMAEKPIPYMTPTEILESFTREEMLVEHKFYLFLCKPRYDRIVRDPRNVSATETANRIALDGVTQDNAEENGVIPLNSLIMVFKFSKGRTASMQGSFEELTPDNEQARIQDHKKNRRKNNKNRKNKTPFFMFGKTPNRRKPLAADIWINKPPDSEKLWREKASIWHSSKKTLGRQYDTSARHQVNLIPTSSTDDGRKDSEIMTSYKDDAQTNKTVTSTWVDDQTDRQHYTRKLKFASRESLSDSRKNIQANGPTTDGKNNPAVVPVCLHGIRRREYRQAKHHDDPRPFNGILKGTFV